MASLESANNSIADARGDILLLMQEGDGPDGWYDEGWAEEMYLAWEALGEALNHLGRAHDLAE